MFLVEKIKTFLREFHDEDGAKGVKNFVYGQQMVCD